MWKIVPEEPIFGLTSSDPPRKYVEKIIDGGFLGRSSAVTIFLQLGAEDLEKAGFTFYPESEPSEKGVPGLVLDALLFLACAAKLTFDDGRATGSISVSDGTTTRSIQVRGGWRPGRVSLELVLGG